jgi:hypothetical protein
VLSRLKEVKKRLACMALLVMVAACAAPADTTGTITGRLVAGPVCPVETDPPDPACVPHPVPDAEVVAMDVDGNEYRAFSGVDGGFRLAVPAGNVVVMFSKVEGLIGVPEAITVTLAHRETVDLGEIGYDTGIR